MRSAAHRHAPQHRSPATTRDRKRSQTPAADHLWRMRGPSSPNFDPNRRRQSPFSLPLRRERCGGASQAPVLRGTAAAKGFGARRDAASVPPRREVVACPCTPDGNSAGREVLSALFSPRVSRSAPAFPPPRALAQECASPGIDSHPPARVTVPAGAFGPASGRFLISSFWLRDPRRPFPAPQAHTHDGVVDNNREDGRAAENLQENQNKQTKNNPNSTNWLVCAPLDWQYGSAPAYTTPPCRARAAESCELAW